MKKLAFLLASALLFTAAVGFTQVNVTSVAGIVSDPTGAAVPGATVQVQSAATGEKTSVVTNDRGEYVVPALAAGSYKLTVSKAGFKTESAA